MVIFVSFNGHDSTKIELNTITTIVVQKLNSQFRSYSLEVLWTRINRSPQTVIDKVKILFQEIRLFSLRR